MPASRVLRRRGRVTARAGARRHRAAALLLSACLAVTACFAPRAAPERAGALPGGVPRHHSVLLAEPELAPVPAFGETPWIDAPFAFDELLVSWNVDVAEKSGAMFSVQVEDASGGRSPWLDVGEWGAVPPERERTLAFEAGRVDVDYVVLERGFARARARMRSVGPRAAHLAHFAFTFSDRHGRFTPAPDPAARAMPEEAVARLPVPFRSQRAAAPALAPRVCSPTSVAMVLAYRGVPVTTEEVAALAYDPLHDLYGSWPRGIQAAYRLGVPGYLTRFEGWREVHARLAAGQPLIVSVRAGPGELRGAPFPSTNGHLVVLSGVDAGGDLLVHDAAAPDALGGVTTYARADLERCWLANGGTAYVLLDRNRAGGEARAVDAAR